jgi:hypothetical protein
MPALSDTERRLMDLLLAGDHPALAVLRTQLAESEIENREFSGVGFFTHFKVPEGCERLPVGHWVIQDVEFRLPGLEYGAGGLLFVVEGALSMLEGFTYGSEAWPADEAGMDASYTRRGNTVGTGYVVEPAPKRDLTWLAETYEEARQRAEAE